MSGIDNLFQEETLLSNIKIAAYFRRIDVTDTWQYFFLKCFHAWCELICVYAS